MLFIIYPLLQKEHLTRTQVHILAGSQLFLLSANTLQTVPSFHISFLFPRFQRKHPPKAPPTSSKSRSISTSAYPTAPISVRPDRQDRQVRQEKPVKLDKPAKQDKQLHKEESRSRLPSISSLQEKLRKRWPRSLRGKESHEKDKLDKPASKYWKSAPRVVSEMRYI